MSAPATPRFGACLEHGAAHAEDHLRWSRRDFLTGLGLAAAGGAFLLGGTPVRAFARSPLMGHLRRLETDRTLVLLQLNGGNDGLNTIVPFENDLYYNARPTLAIARSEVLPLGGDVGMHPSLAPLQGFFGEGRMGVLQNVGYPQPDLSHFRATDIWMTASTETGVEPTGWVGRYLEGEFPDFGEAPLPYPLAVQVGGAGSMLFQGAQANMGMALTSPELFERIAEEGILYQTDGLPATPLGTEVAFVRTVANEAFQYADAVQEASDPDANRVEYPNNGLARNLAIVAQLIKGQLGARIYHVSLGGFDTHADQQGRHANLLSQLAGAVAAFYADLAADGVDSDVLTMTFSEFGRRVQQNASRGTDHGTAAPLFVFGGGVEGGLYGQAPNLSDLDPTGNVAFDLDFRSAYATVLQDWFGMPSDAAAAVLGGTFGTLGFVADPAMPTAAEPEEVVQTFALEQNYPNPFNPRTVIPYRLERSSHVRLDVFDVRGQRVRTLVDGVQAPGTHEATLDATGLASGTYLYRLTTEGGTATRKMLLIR